MISRICETRVLIFIGLVMIPFIPDFKYVSWSLFSLFAVMAMMGVGGRDGWEASNSRILAVDSKPSMTGIWLSIRTTSKEASLKVSKAWSQFSAEVISWPCLFNNFVAKVKLTVVSSATIIFRGAPGLFSYQWALNFHRLKHSCHLLCPPGPKL